MSGKDFEVEEGKEIVGRTIVGGRPAARRKRKVRVPIGIEKLLVRAAANEEFRRRLLDERDATLASLEGELSPTESQVLTSIPTPTLEGMIRNIDLQRHGKRRFMKGVVAAALLTTAAAGTLGCEVFETQTKGISPDELEDVVTETVVAPDATSRGMEPDEDVLVVEDSFDIKGITPDMEEEADVIEVPDLPAPTGIMPDTEETH
jgi:hypothetical protein